MKEDGRTRTSVFLLQALTSSSICLSALDRISKVLLAEGQDPKDLSFESVTDKGRPALCDDEEKDGKGKKAGEEDIPSPTPRAMAPKMTPKTTSSPTTSSQKGNAPSASTPSVSSASFTSSLSSTPSKVAPTAHKSKPTAKDARVPTPAPSSPGLEEEAQVRVRALRGATAQLA
jgi:hypothetical protein